MFAFAVGALTVVGAGIGLDTGLMTGSEGWLHPPRSRTENVKSAMTRTL